jgi:hypothetical protein
MDNVGVNDLGIAERGNDALDAFLHDRGEQAVLAAEKRIYGGLGRAGALDDEVDGEARRVKAAACALVEPDVIRLCRDRQTASPALSESSRSGAHPGSRRD